MTTDSLHYILIMAGGEGTRFAPLSTPERPKQFLNFIGGRTFIRQTFERVLPLAHVSNIYVSTNDKFVGLVKEQLPELPPENIIGEPMKKNTGPALAYCMSVISARYENAVVICLPSDHHIADEEGFRRVLTNAVALAHDGYLVTLGMSPTWPSPEYGYIRAANVPLLCKEGKGEVDQVFPVSAFVEKPDTATATGYVANKSYYWNGGIFIWKAKTFFEELSKHAPDLVPCALSHTPYSYFSSAPSVSIDYALMEKTSKAVVIPTNVGWSDVGTWESLHRLSKSGVRIAPEAEFVMMQKLGYVRPIAGMPLPRRVEKPWGFEEIWAHTGDYVGKILKINKGHRLSSQYHSVKEETIRILEGVMKLEFDNAGQANYIEMKQGDTHHIPPKTRHRMTAIENCRVLEVSTPYLADVVRIEDDYDRV